MRKVTAILVGVVVGYGILSINRFVPNWYFEFVMKWVLDTSLVQYLLDFDSEKIEFIILLVMVALVNFLPLLVISLLCVTLGLFLKSEKYLFYANLVGFLFYFLLGRLYFKLVGDEFVRISYLNLQSLMYEKNFFPFLSFI